jgi:fructokinase
MPEVVRISIEGVTMRIGIDLGGTKIEGIVIDPEGKELVRKRIPTPRHDYGSTIAQIVSLIKDIASQARTESFSVGIACPGAISPASGLMKNANSTWIIGKPLQKDLEQSLGQEISMSNDANCFALSEATDGAAAGAEVVFGVIIGTGCGGGVVVRGADLTGINAIAGEWGHNPLPWPSPDEMAGAPACYCGKKGCIETYLSGTGFAKRYEEAVKSSLTAPEILNFAQSGDREANNQLHRYYDRMARSLATVINLIDPDVIVLGGGMSNIESLYDEVPNRWGQYVFSDRVDTKLVQALHGDSSGVRGAAWLNAK